MITCPVTETKENAHTVRGRHSSTDALASTCWSRAVTWHRRYIIVTSEA